MIPIRATIERRLLLNYRVEPARIQALLPEPLRPALVGAHAVAGICMIRLGRARPAGVPGVFGLTTENAAHRIAVEWDEDGVTRKGVYIPRRDTSSRITASVARHYYGEHKRANFSVDEHDDFITVRLTSGDGQADVDVIGRLGGDMPAESIFRSLAAASALFQDAPMGFSPAANELVGVQLQTERWSMQPFSVERLSSRFFDDQARFPLGSATFDCAMVMRNIPSLWSRVHTSALPTTTARTRTAAPA